MKQSAIKIDRYSTTPVTEEFRPDSTDQLPGLKEPDRVRKRRSRRLTPRVRRSLQTQLQLVLLHLHSHATIRPIMRTRSFKLVLPVLARQFGVFNRLYLAPLRTAIRRPGPLKILILCKGNICRSAYACERLREQLVRFGPAVEICSAGLWTKTGKPADPDAVRNAASRGVDLSTHVTTAVTEQHIQTAGLILLMDGSNYSMIRKLFPAALTKSMYLGALDPKQSVFSALEVPDPYGKSDKAFASCFDKIDRSLDELVLAISEVGA